jgi:hypothetical protein
MIADSNNSRTSSLLSSLRMLKMSWMNQSHMFVSSLLIVHRRRHSFSFVQIHWSFARCFIRFSCFFLFRVWYHWCDDESSSLLRIMIWFMRLNRVSFWASSFSISFIANSIFYLFDYFSLCFWLKSNHSF